MSTEESSSVGEMLESKTEDSPLKLEKQLAGDVQMNGNVLKENGLCDDGNVLEESTNEQLLQMVIELKFQNEFFKSQFEGLKSHQEAEESGRESGGCLQSFVPRTPDSWNKKDWIGGCVRRTQLGCKNGDGFLQLTGVKLPDMSDSWVNTSMSLVECRNMCLSNCSCVAYANPDIRRGESDCYLWFDELKDTKKLPLGGQDLYIRMAASELATYEKQSSSKSKRRGIIIGTLISAVVLLVLGLILYMRRRKTRRRQARSSSIRVDYFKDESNRKDDMELPAFDFTTIANATDYFSYNNKLGEGGFGTVYKGTLTDAQEIAVKRLSKSSVQGMDEFKNEVKIQQEENYWSGRSV